MALPLLLLAGAGMLGGTQYLMKRADQRRGQSMLNDLQGMVQHSALDPMQQDHIMAMAQSTIDNDSFWNRNMVSSQIEQLQSAVTQASANRMDAARQAIASSAAAQQKVNADRAFQVGNSMYDDYRQDMSGFATVQDAYKRGMAALDGGNQADSIAALYNFFNLIEPGGIVRDSESGMYSGIGGTFERLANAFNEMAGKGAGAETIRQVKAAMKRQYQPVFERATRSRQDYETRIADWRERLGQYVQSPIGRLGLDWKSPDFNPAADSAQPSVTDRRPPERKPYKGKNDAWVGDDGYIYTTDPNYDPFKKRRSVREQRGRGR